MKGSESNIMHKSSVVKYVMCSDVRCKEVGGNLNGLTQNKRTVKCNEM
jgi:hypothetical protein